MNKIIRSLHSFRPCYIKAFFLFLLTALLLTTDPEALAQTGPLTPTGFIHRDEIILIYDEIYMSEPATINEQGLKLRKDYEAAGRNENLTGRAKNSRPAGSYDNRHIDAISGDFNGDRKAEYLYTYSGINDSLRLTLVSADTALQSVKRIHYKVNGTSVQGKNLVWGDVNGDQLAEFAVAYKEFGTGITKIGVFHINGDLEIIPMEVISDISVTGLIILDFGDFDGDDNDEIVVGFQSETPSENYFLKVYDFSGTFQLIPREQKPFIFPVNSNSNCTVALKAEDADGDGKDEIVVAFGRNESDTPNNDDTFIYVCDVTDDAATAGTDLLEKLNIYIDKGISDRLSNGECHEILLKSGDLNGDGQKDIILGTSRGIKVYNVTANNDIEDMVDYTMGGFHEDNNNNSVNYFEVADITGDEIDELITSNHFHSNEPDGTQYFILDAYQYDSLFDENHIAHLNRYQEIDKNTTIGTGGSYGRHYAIAVADFDGEVFRLGDYVSYACWQQVVTPVSVLNTPPVHIDYISGAVRDISSCFGQNDCESSIQKTETTSDENSYSIKASHSGDWGYAPRVDYLGLDIGKLFGGDLEQVNTTNTSITESKETFVFQTSSMDEHGSSDDAILTTICNYEKWEYPLFDRNNILLGNIIVVKTDVDRTEKWFNGKDIMEISGLLQLHEQGNLLSYRKFYNDPVKLKEVTPDIRQIISVATDHTLDNNSSYEESITWSKNFESSSISKTNTVEVNPSTSLDLFGIDYFDLRDESVAEEEIIKIHTYEVGESFGLKLLANDLLGDIYTYTVRPYYYWSTSGALVVDYMVDLSEGSFWSDNYGTQDPGFLFPNRLDSLKVKSDESKITDLEQYIKTPSIFLDPTVPESGDTVVVSALIHNLSLSPTAAPVSLKFYLGDPNKGGTVLTDIEGKSAFTTSAVIGDQNYAFVKMTWVADFDPGDRIYCMIDPENDLAENNEDNNLGWTPVQRFQAGCDIIMGIDDIGDGNTPASNNFSLKIYPNPANDRVSFDYSGPAFTDGNISLVDLNGKILKTLKVNDAAVLSSLSIDIGEYNKGTYLLILTTKNYIQHSRLVIQ